MIVSLLNEVLLLLVVFIVSTSALAKDLSVVDVDDYDGGKVYLLMCT